MLGRVLEFLSFLGLGHPVARAVSFASIGFAFQYFFRPGISYLSVPSPNKSGSTIAIPKEFYFTSDKEDKLTTYFPWYSWPALGAIIGGFFL